MYKNIICLDLDDCIYPNDVNYFGNTNDSLKIFELNLIRLNMIISKYDFKIILTSSWSKYYKLINNKVELDVNTIDFNSCKKSMKVLYYIKKYILHNIIDISSGDRKQDILMLQQSDEINKIIVLDDWDLSEVCELSSRTLYIKMFGFIDGNVGYLIDNFMNYGLKLQRDSFY